MTAAVVDNTLLSNFAHIQQPKLLESAFDQPVTVRAVMDELEVGVQTTRIPSVDWSWLSVIELTDEEHAMTERLNQSLGRGEAECIALAKSRQWIILTAVQSIRSLNWTLVSQFHCDPSPFAQSALLVSSGYQALRQFYDNSFLAGA